MSPARRIKTFTDKYPFVGPAFWIVTVQYIVAQIAAAGAWDVHYSLRHNVISDLGNTGCGNFAGRFVCSPLHDLMNVSFVVLGITMLVGAGLIYQEFKETEGSALGFGFMGLAGIGTLIVGLFPENSIPALHGLGAFLPFFIGNIGMVLLGWVLNVPWWLKVYSVVSGLIALVGFGLFTTHHYLGVGVGGMERLTAYPQTAWLIVFGLYISSSHIQKIMATRSS